MNKLWVDKYRPKKLEELDYHKDLTTSLRKLGHAEDFPHILFYGPNGAGKKTRVMGFLQEVYGSGVYKIKTDTWEFKTSATSSNTVEICILSSNYHIDINPSDVE